MCARITAVEAEGDLQYEAEYGELTEERKSKIHKAIADGIEHGYDLKSIKHRYFFVDKFHEADFKKITPRAPMGTRIFDFIANSGDGAVTLYIQKLRVVKIENMELIIRGF